MNLDKCACCTGLWDDLEKGCFCRYDGNPETCEGPKKLPTPYYDVDGITIYHGDCREILPYLPKVDLVLTDPPYEDQAHTKQRSRAFMEGRQPDRNILPFGPITDDTRSVLVQEAMRLCSGWALIFSQAEAIGEYARLFGSAWRRPMVWIKPDSLPQFSGDRPAMGYESIAAAWCGEGRSIWTGGGRRGVFTHNCTGFAKDHPTQKPVELIRELMILFGGDTILDPFMGSGTTLRAAKDLGRRAIGIELEEKYCEIAVKRLGQGVLPL